MNFIMMLATAWCPNENQSTSRTPTTTTVDNVQSPHYCLQSMISRSHLLLSSFRASYCLFIAVFFLLHTSGFAQEIPKSAFAQFLSHFDLHALFYFSHLIYKFK